MDLLIKGLGLPAKDDEPIYIEINPNGKIYQKGKCLHYWGELPNKAIELPPHGRLIDADANREDFMNTVYSELYSDGDNYRANRIIDEYDNAPTIVEAST